MHEDEMRAIRGSGTRISSSEGHEEDPSVRTGPGSFKITTIPGTGSSADCIWVKDEEGCGTGAGLTTGRLEFEAKVGRTSAKCRF